MTSAGSPAKGSTSADGGRGAAWPGQRRQPDRVALRSGEFTQNWSELAAQVGRIAGGLAALGVGKGDTVALMLSNRPEFVACDLAAIALGAVPFSLYQTSSAEQIAYVAGGDPRRRVGAWRR